MNEIDIEKPVRSALPQTIYQRKQNWWHHAVLYELYVDKFANDFRGLTERLDYIERLGVNCLHILPHYPSPMVDDGYDISEYRAIRSTLGTMDDFKHFTEAAHARGIYVLVDMVLNHLSSQHPWFTSARTSHDSPYRNYFLWSDTGTEYSHAVNPFFHLKPHNWIKNEATNDFYFSTFYPEQPDLNWDEPGVFEDMCASMDFWIDAGVDAFRFDAAPHLIKREGTNCHGLPETHALLKRIRARLDTRHANIAILGEVEDTLERTRAYFGNGDECHLLYNFPLAALLVHAAMMGDTGTDTCTTSSPEEIPPNCAWTNFLRNHDSLVLNLLPPEQQALLRTYADPGNHFMFRGEEGLSMRLASIFAHEPEKVRTAFQLLFSTTGIPVIYYGDEIGMQNDTTIDTSPDTRRFVRGTFDWSKAQQQMQDPDSLFSFVANTVRTHRGTTPSDVQHAHR
ncbi:MAG: hypothetical protein KBD21_00530 [Candidatus Pacebacteria bacterium]|nr:hypothetical protein [Candidatus Paceibacterota bacterium]